MVRRHQVREHQRSTGSHVRQHLRGSEDPRERGIRLLRSTMPYTQKDLVTYAREVYANEIAGGKSHDEALSIALEAMERQAEVHNVFPGVIHDAKNVFMRRQRPFTELQRRSDGSRLVQLHTDEAVDVPYLSQDVFYDTGTDYVIVEPYVEVRPSLQYGHEAMQTRIEPDMPEDYHILARHHEKLAQRAMGSYGPDGTVSDPHAFDHHTEQARRYRRYAAALEAEQARDA